MEVPMAYRNPDAVIPGPIHGSVLYDQKKHVSSTIWIGQERGALRCYEHTSKLDQWKLTDKQIDLVERAGFQYLRSLPSISLDNLLISALVERWRRETNTFHLSVGEMTVTLTDVALLLGLAIEGEPVIGFTYTSCSSVCESFLGRAPGPRDASGGMVKLCWLKKSFSQCPEDAPDEVIKSHTRAYILYLIGSTIFCTTTGNKVPVMYLPLLENFDNAGNYAWGAAALAFLYRALGNASLGSQVTLSGCLTLLQCWSYYHLNVGRPKPTPNPMQDCFPYALRWKGKQLGPSANRDVVFYRKALDDLKPCDVEWLPYKQLDSSVIPESIKYNLDVGRSRTMLICFEKAERHLPDRCLRQYGFLQPIPEDVEQWERRMRGAYDGIDLSMKMESELNEWYDRKYHIVNDDYGVEESEYMQWYLKITRKIVGRPTSLLSESQRLSYRLRDIANIVNTFSTKGLDEEQIQAITQIKYLTHDCSTDQVEEAVSVSATSPTHPGKRIRGEEKVSRNSTGKRKREENLMQFHLGSEDAQSRFYAATVVVDQQQFSGADTEVNQMCHETGEAESMHLVNTTENINDEQLYDAAAVTDGSNFANFSNDVNDYQFCGSVSELCNKNINDTHTGQTRVHDDCQFTDAYVNNQHGVALVDDFQPENVHVTDSYHENALKNQSDDIPICDSHPTNVNPGDSRPSDGAEEVYDSHDAANQALDCQFPGANINNQQEVALVNGFQPEDVHVTVSYHENALKNQSDDIPICDSQPTNVNPGDSRPSDGAEEVYDSHDAANQALDCQFPGAYINNQQEVALVNGFQPEDVHVTDSYHENALKNQSDDIPICDSQPTNVNPGDSRPSDGAEEVYDSHDAANQALDCQFPGAYINNQQEVALVNGFQPEDVYVTDSTPENASEKKSDDILIDDSQLTGANPSDSRASDGAEEVVHSHDAANQVDDIEHHDIVQENGMSQAKLQEVPQSYLALGDTAAQ